MSDMKCKYCNQPMTAIEGIKGMHYKCSDLALGEWVQDALEIYKKAFELACKSLEDTRKNWLTPGGWSLEHTFLKQAQREIERSADCGI